jgi:hypothetical protein
LLVSVLATAGIACVAEPATDASIQNGGALPQEVVALADTSANLGTVTGRIFSQINGAVVEFAVVEIVAQDRAISTLSDGSGRYRLDRVPPGSRLIRARALDHSELVIGVRVPPRGVISLDLTLAVQPIEMAPLSAHASRVDAEPVKMIRVLAEETPTGTPADAELRVLESSPGMAELGLVQIIQAASSPDPDDPSSILYVRGATSDLKLVLLDGAPVYAPFHLGGLIQAFMPGVLGHSRPYVGGAPARFNGGLSYILDLGSRPGRTDRFHTSGALDMMSTRGEVEGPLPGGSFLVGGRYIHAEGPDRITGEELPYDYGDALLRMDWGIGREGTLSVTGFYNREGVDLTRDETAAGTENAIADEEPNAADLVLDPPAREARPKSQAEWGNVAGSVRYFGRAFDSDLELTAALGEFTTRLPLDGATPLLVDGLSRRMRLAGTMSRWIGGAQLELGASFDRVSLQRRRVGRCACRGNDAPLAGGHGPRGTEGGLLRGRRTPGRTQVERGVDLPQGQRDLRRRRTIPSARALARDASLLGDRELRRDRLRGSGRRDDGDRPVGLAGIQLDSLRGRNQQPCPGALHRGAGGVRKVVRAAPGRPRPRDLRARFLGPAERGQGQRLGRLLCRLV